MIGGEVIGQGTYGCAVIPPLICKGKARQERMEQFSKQADGQTVGKLTLKMDADTELAISATLRKDKLWKNYFILPELVDCTPSQQQRIDDWNECKITSQVIGSDLRQLVSGFGGESFASLGDINLGPSSFDFFKFMRHTLEGCAILALHGIVHYDLHKSNILIDKYKVPRLLDFGMSFDASEITSTILDMRWKVYDPKYDSEPPEVTVITGIRNKMNLNTLIEDAIYQKPVFKEYELVFGTPRSELERKFKEFFQKSQSFARKDWVSFYKTYWPGLDSFALGAVLLHVLKLQLTWPLFVNSEEWKKQKQVVEQVLKAMLAPDPSVRFDCVEALSLYQPDSVVLKNSEDWLAARRKQRLE